MFAYDPLLYLPLLLASFMDPQRRCVVIHIPFTPYIESICGHPLFRGWQYLYSYS